jgi:hypothetical protein
MSTPIFFTVKFTNTTVINTTSEEVSFRLPGTVGPKSSAKIDGYSTSLDTQKEFYTWRADAEAEIPPNWVCVIMGLDPNGGVMECHPISGGTGGTEHFFSRADPLLRDA